MPDNPSELDPKKYQQVSNLLKEIRRGYADLKQANPFDGETAQSFITSLGDADSAVIKLVDGVDQVEKKLDKVGKSAKRTYENIVNVRSEIGKTNINFGITTKELKKIQNISETLKNDQEGINRLSIKELEALVKKKAISDSNLSIAKKQFTLDSNGNQLYGAALNNRLKKLTSISKENGGITKAHADQLHEAVNNKHIFDEIDATLQSRIEKEEKIKDLTGMTTGILSTANSVMKKFGLNIPADKFKELQEGAREYTEELLDQNASQKALNELIQEAQKKGIEGPKDAEGNLEVEKSLKSDGDMQAEVFAKSFKDGAELFSKEIGAAINVAIIKGLKEGVKSFNESREGLAKSFAMGRDASYDMMENLNYMAKSSGETAFNTADAVIGMQEFNKEVKGALILTTDQLKTYSLLSNEFGLTAHQAASITKSSILNGVLAEDYANRLRGQVQILAEGEGIAVNQQEIFAAIGDYSAATKLTMEGQGKALSQAAYESAKLGMNQSQLNKTADSLLDFESSIAAEMEAELMTGKQLNLEDARRAALMDDQAGLAKAISREIGTSAEFGEYNVMQQKSLAKAFGMSREELAETLVTQELLASQTTTQFKSMEEGKKAYQKLVDKGLSAGAIEKELGKSKLTDQLAAESSAKRFSDVTIKLKDQLLPILELLSKFIDKLVDIVDYMTSFKDISTSIGKMMGIIAGIKIGGMFTTAITKLKDMFKYLGKITGMVSSLFGSSGSSGGKAVVDASVDAGGSLAQSTGKTVMEKGVKAATQSGGSGIMSGIGSLFQKLNPKNAMVAAKKLLSDSAPKFLKSAAKKIPYLGTLIESIFAASDIKSMIAAGGKESEVNQMIGKRSAEAIGAIGGMGLGGVLGSFLGPVGTFVGAMGGDMLGRWAGGALADGLGAEGLGKVVGSVFAPDIASDTAEDFISRPGQPIQKFRADDIVMAGTSLGGGDGGKIEKLLEKLLSAVEKGGDVYMDGALVGSATTLAYNKL